MIGAKEFFSEPPKKLEWTVRNLVEQGTFVVLGGEPKTSKTWAVLEMALSVASGTDCFNSFEFTTFHERRPVYLFLLEDNFYNVQARLVALGAAKGLSVDDLKELPLFIRCRKPLNLLEDSGQIIDTVSALQIGDEENGLRDGLIIIDPLRNAHNQDENDSGSMKLVMERCISIRDRTKCSLIINHHFKKMKKSDEETPGNAMRGSSTLYGAVDGIIGMRKIECNERNVWENNVHCQVKAGPQASPFGLTLRVKDGAESGRSVYADWEVSETFGR